MKAPGTRREFLAEVGRGMLVVSVGSEVAQGLGLASSPAEEPTEALTFGVLEPLVVFPSKRMSSTENRSVDAFGR